MKKIITLFTVLALGSAMLVSCGGSGEGETPAADTTASDKVVPEAKPAPVQHTETPAPAAEPAVEPATEPTKAGKMSGEGTTKQEASTEDKKAKMSGEAPTNKVEESTTKKKDKMSGGK